MTQFQLGSISHGTLRTQDLLPVFLETFIALGGNVPADLECGSYIEYLNWPNPETTACDEDDKFWASEDAMWDMEALTDGLNNLCPPFVYFGTLEGDGSDFGFWPDMDSLNEELQWERDHWPDDSIPDALELEDYNVIVQVSDHGNVTVMDMDRNVIWAVV
tara:strand:- start:280 stop:762 length:483 start_codon:yes stop_codon:yes gene_type:complete